jgi:AcrR family transcriptional regulator
MPRVSDQYLAARRQQILDAARVCFTRNGFHATSMHDVIAEAGLSVGAVYRYFKSKDELVTAIASQITDEVADQIRAMPTVPLEQAVDRVLDDFEPRLGPNGVFRLALQVWAESLRNPTLADLIRQVYGTLRDRFVDLARRAQDAGHLSPKADPEAVGAVLFGMVLGYMLQRTLTGRPDRDTFHAGVRDLLA